MHVTRLELESFKGFREFTVDLSDFTCLVGLNSMGKTSILQAIRFIFDMLVFTFGNEERPNFANPRWRTDPMWAINRMNFGDPDAIWLRKNTSEPCKVKAYLSNSVQVNLEVPGRNQYELDILFEGTSIRDRIRNEADIRELIEKLYEFRPEFVPPVGAVTPAEQYTHYPTMRQEIDRGRLSEFWRAQLFWLCNEENEEGVETFRNVVEMVQRYLPDVNVLRPRLTKTGNANILIEFTEDETTLDIGSAGGGLRTLLNIAVELCMSPSKCFLFDEPDAHLHSSLQRAIAQMFSDYSGENGVQILVSSHAPDFIAEMPVESLIWIDRTERGGRRCGEVGQVLVDLGCISKADAVRARGADKVLFVEASTDRKVLKALYKHHCTNSVNNPFDDEAVIVANLPRGKGYGVHIHMFAELLRHTYSLAIRIACITDMDYELEEPEQQNSEQRNRDVLTLLLPRKEIENYLLDSAIVRRALEYQAQKRGQSTNSDCPVPSEDEIEGRIESLILSENVQKKVKCQLVPRYRSMVLDKSLDDATKEAQADRWFEEKWNDSNWRRQKCPGKDIIKGLKRWCQSEYKLPLSENALIQALQVCPEELAQLFIRLESHLYANQSPSSTARYGFKAKKSL